MTKQHKDDEMRQDAASLFRSEAGSTFAGVAEDFFFPIDMATAHHELAIAHHRIDSA